MLRFYCDLNVDQSAQVLGCTAGTVKSQTAKALAGLRRTLGRPAEGDGAPEPAARTPRSAGKVADHA